MGNCFAKPKKSSAEIAPSDILKGSPPVTLYGPESCPVTLRIRIALRYKTIPLQFIPSENPNFELETPVIQCGKENVTGSPETLLRYIDSKFPGPPLLAHIGTVRKPIPAIVVAATLQHRSITWHLDMLVRWSEDLIVRKTRGTSRAFDSSMGSPRMEVRKFGRSYSQLLEVMLEHAQMEERIVFPVLERADRGLCKGANEEHGRDLPIMNGINEDMKSIGVLNAGSPVYQEAMSNLSSRLKTLQAHCKVHFEEEERELLPLLEAAELSKARQEGVLIQCFEVMESSHSHLLHFLISGLLPHDAMQYLDVVSRCTDRQQVAAILGTLTDRIEGVSSRSEAAHHHMV